MHPLEWHQTSIQVNIFPLEGVWTYILLTLGETNLINSFKNLNFPTSLWNLRPQFFIQASRTCKRKTRLDKYLRNVQDYAEGYLNEKHSDIIIPQTVNACIASHSWGDWILWANSLTDICGLKNMTERNNPTQTQKQRQYRVLVITGFIISSMFLPQWGHRRATSDECDSTLWEKLSLLNACDHTLLAPYWFGHRTPLYTPSLPLCWKG